MSPPPLSADFADLLPEDPASGSVKPPSPSRVLSDPDAVMESPVKEPKTESKPQIPPKPKNILADPRLKLKGATSAGIQKHVSPRVVQKQQQQKTSSAHAATRRSPESISMYRSGKPLQTIPEGGGPPQSAHPTSMPVSLPLPHVPLDDRFLVEASFLVDQKDDPALLIDKKVELRQEVDEKIKNLGPHDAHHQANIFRREAQIKWLDFLSTTEANGSAPIPVLYDAALAKHQKGCVLTAEQQVMAQQAIAPHTWNKDSILPGEGEDMIGNQPMSQVIEDVYNDWKDKWSAKVGNDQQLRKRWGECVNRHKNNSLKRCKRGGRKHFLWELWFWWTIRQNGLPTVHQGLPTLQVWHSQILNELHKDKTPEFEAALRSTGVNPEMRSISQIQQSNLQASNRPKPPHLDDTFSSTKEPDTTIEIESEDQNTPNKAAGTTGTSPDMANLGYPPLSLPPPVPKVDAIAEEDEDIESYHDSQNRTIDTLNATRPRYDPDYDSDRDYGDIDPYAEEEEDEEKESGELTTSTVSDDDDKKSQHGNDASNEESDSDEEPEEKMEEDPPKSPPPKSPPPKTPPKVLNPPVVPNPTPSTPPNKKASMAPPAAAIPPPSPAAIPPPPPAVIPPPPPPATVAPPPAAVPAPPPPPAASPAPPPPSTVQMSPIRTDETEKKKWSNYTMGYFFKTFNLKVSKVTTLEKYRNYWRTGPNAAYAVQDNPSDPPKLYISIPTTVPDNAGTDRIPTTIVVYWNKEQKEYYAFFRNGTVDDPKHKSLDHINIMLRSLNLPKVSKRDVANRICAFDSYSKGIPPVDVKAQTSARDDICSRIRLAAICANATSPYDHLKLPELVLPKPIEQFQPIELATELSGGNNEPDHSVQEVLPPACLDERLHQEYDDPEIDAGHYGSKSMKLDTYKVFPNADSSFRNLVLSYCSYWVDPTYLGSTQAPHEVIPACRDILGRHVPYPTSPIGERHSVYQILGIRTRVHDSKWPLGLRNYLLKWKLESSVNQIKVSQNCCGLYIIEYHDVRGPPGRNDWLLYREKQNVKALPYGGKQCGEVLEWWSRTTHIDALAEWFKYRAYNAKTKSSTFRSGIKEWFDNWIEDPNHPIPVPASDPRTMPIDMLMDYLVRLDIWWHSLYIPYREYDIPAHSRTWLRNIAVTRTNVQNFMSRYHYLNNEYEKEQLLKRGGPARSGAPPGSTLPSRLAALSGTTGETSSGTAGTAWKVPPPPKERDNSGPGRLKGWGDFDEIKTSTYAAPGVPVDNSNAVNQRIDWVKESWREAVFKVCELADEGAQVDLPNDYLDACHTPKTHTDDGVFCVYVQKLIAGTVQRMDAADHDLFETVITSTITNKMAKGDFTSRINIIECKFIIEKGISIICCSDQQSLDITSMVIKNLEWPHRYKVSHSAFSEVWQIKLAFPKEFNCDDPSMVVTQLRTNNGNRFKFLHELPGKPEVKGNHLVWTIDVSEEDAKEVLSGGEIFHYTLGHGYVMGFKRELPNQTVSALCQFYRRTLREILSCDRSKLREEVAKRYDDLPQPPKPVVRSWATISSDDKIEDPEEVRKYRDELTAIFPAWKETFYDSSVQVMAKYSWKAIDGLANSAERHERNYLKKPKAYRFLKYPSEVLRLDLPMVGPIEARYEDYINALDSLREEISLGDPDPDKLYEVDLQLADEKMRILKYITAQRRRRAWEQAATKSYEIDNYLKNEQEKENRRRRRVLQHRKEAIIAGGGTVKEGELILDEASESAIKFVTPDEIVKRINDTKDTKIQQKRKRDTSAGRPPKKRSTDPEGMETDDPTTAGSTDPAGKADKTG